MDYDFIAGDEQNKTADDIQSPTSRLISSSGQFKQQHSLNGWFALDKQWSVGAEVLYGTGSLRQHNPITRTNPPADITAAQKNIAA
jgi:hypothetical protein